MSRILLLLIANLLLLSCKTIDRSASQTSGLAFTGRLWENPRDIRVCIVNRVQISDEIFLDLRDWVKREYKERVDIEFTGWEQCTESEYAAAVIRVYFYPGEDWEAPNPYASSGFSQVGRYAPSCTVNCDRGTMRLTVGKNFRYPQNDNRDFLRSYMLHTAMHEFGHALGLMHEQLRSDAPGCRELTMKIPAGEQYAYIGAYDPESVMNYCKTNKDGRLSQGDIITLRSIYFREQWKTMPVLGASDVGGGAEGSLWFLGQKELNGNAPLYRLDDDRWLKFDSVSGIALDVGPDGNPWIVKANGDILRYDGRLFEHMPGRASDIGIGSNGSVWIISTVEGKSNGIASWDGKEWRSVPGSGSAIAVGPDGNPWMVDDKHRIWQWNGTEWIFVEGSARDIAIGKDGFPWIISTETSGGAYAVFKWNGGGWISRPVSGSRISVRGFDHPVIIDENNDLLVQ